MVKHLRDDGWLADPRVEAALLEVPRHVFLPGVGLATAYADEAVVTRYKDGLPASSASQPAIVAAMLVQLNPPAGGCVLEVGAGTGYNAALLSALVGPAGQVVTVEIDPEVAVDAERHLSDARVANAEVICGDGAAGWPAGAPYDGIIVTAGASDLAPAWFSQLAEAGRLVVPLSIRGAQQCVAFARADCHLRSVAVCEAGFMPLTGAMANADIRLPVPGRPGVHVVAAPGTAVDAGLIAAGLDAIGPAVAIGIRATRLEAFGSLGRWLALRAPAPATLIYSGPAKGAAASGVPPVAELSAGGTTQRLSPCLLGESGLAIVDVMPGQAASADQDPHIPRELAVRACGTAEHQSRQLSELVRDWDAAHRPDAGHLLIDAYPSHVTVPDTPGSVHRAEHTTFLVNAR
jgi:protein-L-isoaspartate(D-aspartate) O-methyltransferase